MTYSDEKVVRLLDENFVCVQVDTTSPTETGQEAMDFFGQKWTPMILFLDPDEREARRLYGYFPPEEYVPQTYLGLGQLALLEDDPGQAFEYFRKVADEYAGSKCAPEAIYWCGVAAYKRDDDADQLIKHWKELGQKHRDSSWWTRASFIED